MPILWRVDVGGVSHRFVEAGTTQEAIDLVAASLIASFDLRVTRANATLTKVHSDAGPLKKKSLLASLDGLIDPTAHQDARLARRRLARLIRQDCSARAWLRDQAAKLPPLASPGRIEELVRSAEVHHIERNFGRLRSWERRSPLHD